ncbi:MAG: hypothetical protein AAGJ94_15405, partial [Pseudomonadota bacterium]
MSPNPTEPDPMVPVEGAARSSMAAVTTRPRGFLVLALSSDIFRSFRKSRLTIVAAFITLVIFL